MKYAYVVGAVACALCVGVCEAEEADKKAATQETIVVGKDAPVGQVKHLDLGDSGASTNENVAQVGIMQNSSDFDDNTGLQDVVPSDGEGEIQ
jgi:hypothetical protein